MNLEEGFVEDITDFYLKKSRAERQSDVKKMFLQNHDQFLNLMEENCHLPKSKRKNHKDII